MTLSLDLYFLSPQFDPSMTTTPAPTLPRAKRSPSSLRDCRSRKREKYARRACALCKIRKVKCSGNQPCSRCEELQGECIYTDASQSDIKCPAPRGELDHDAELDQGIHVHTNSGPPSTRLDLELSVLRVSRICEQIQQSMGRSVGSPPSRPCLQRKRPRQNETLQATARTPTNFRCTQSLTRHALRTRGLPSPPDFHDSYPSPATEGDSMSPDALITLLQAARPVLELGHGKVTDLLTVFRQEIYPLHPCISLQVAQDLVDSLFALLTRVPHGAIYNLELIDIEIMKSVMAIALLAKDDIQNPLASDLEREIMWSVDTCFDQERLQIEDIIMASLLSLYSDLKHRPLKAWRLSGVAARMCLELGIHQERFFDGAQIHPNRIIDCKRLFACVYNTDRRCSFYSGLPWTLHDREIDLSALQLEPQESYLSTMISLDRSLSETWTIINCPSSPSKKACERAEFLNFQLQKLVDSIPTTDFPQLDPTIDSPSWFRVGLQRFCRLRVHHIKMLNYIGSFGSIRDLISQAQSARTLLTLAGEAVHLHEEMMNDGVISPLLLPPAIKLLLASLSFMLLVVSQHPAKYGHFCSKPLHSAIDILNDAEGRVEDQSLDICVAVEELRRTAEIIPLPPPKSPALLPLANPNHVAANSTHLGGPFAGGSVFEELQTPESDIFSILGDTGIAATDMLYLDHMFG